MIEIYLKIQTQVQTCRHRRYLKILTLVKLLGQPTMFQKRLVFENINPLVMFLNTYFDLDRKSNVV